MKKILLLILLFPILSYGNIEDEFPIIIFKNKTIVISASSDIPENFIIKYKGVIYEGYNPSDPERGIAIVNTLTDEIIEFFSVEDMIQYFNAF